jgi:hypothetical protein
VSPTGGEVGIGYFGYAGEGHDFIIRFGLHGYWMLLGTVSERRMPLFGLAGVSGRNFSCVGVE